MISIIKIVTNFRLASTAGGGTELNLAPAKEVLVDDRRNFHRWNCQLPCEFEAGKQVLKGCVVNLSFNGACIETSELSPPVDCVMLTTIEPDGRAVRMRGKVIYSRDGSFGLTFQEDRQQAIRLLMPFFQDRIQAEAAELADAS